MSGDLLIGVIVTTVALAVMLALVWVSKRRIDRIAESPAKTVRDIVRELDHER